MPNIGHPSSVHVARCPLVFLAPRSLRLASGGMEVVSVDTIGIAPAADNRPRWKGPCFPLLNRKHTSGESLPSHQSPEESPPGMSLTSPLRRNPPTSGCGSSSQRTRLNLASSQRKQADAQRRLKSSGCTKRNKTTM